MTDAATYARVADLAARLNPDKHWRDAYREVARHVRTFLDDLPPGETRTTTGLAHALWPMDLTRGPDQARARLRLLRALQALAEHDLADYATKGAPVRRRTVGTIRPWLWHRKYEAPQPPAEPRSCPHCGGLLP